MQNPPDSTPRSGDALMVVDIQNDFLPGGALAVLQGNRVMAPLNRYIGLFHDRGLPIFATRDWHPEDHCSFQAQGGPWPPHCIAGTPGAEFPPDLELPEETVVISKATAPGLEAYSGFEGTDLARRLREAGVGRVFVGGLATDYCVQATVSDALKAGFDALVLTDAVRAVAVHPGDGQRALEAMRRAGAVLTDLGTLGA
jgi:nicotinamidase/pyrazinamidase